MIIQCPRCGFSQPQDKYCAQCGVDIDNYRPPAESLSTKFLGNYILHISLFSIIAIVSIYLLYKNNTWQISDKVDLLKGNLQIFKSVAKTNSEESAPPTAATPVAPEPASPPAADASTETPIAAQSKAAATESTPVTPEATAGAAAKKVSQLQLKVYYIEVSRPQLMQILMESRNAGQFNDFGDHAAGLILHAKARVGQLKAIHTEDKKVEPNKPLQWFLGINPNDPDNEIGLSSYIELTEMENQQVRGNLEIVRSWREKINENQYAVEKRFFPATFDLQIDTGFFITGLLPHRSFHENDPLLTSKEPFSILKSENFKNNQSELIIFFILERS